MLIAALPTAAGRARAYTRSALHDWRLDVLIDTAELLVSELVTNAMKATGAVTCPVRAGRRDKEQPIYLCLSAFTESLLIEVWDTSDDPPLRRTASDDDENGRGLLLVQTLSKNWGYESLHSGGKIVWCECPILE
ncbi:ATP-binding protein [Actinoallomurus spadix]|uniref:Histidine kinase/HSP90-like ATPase domain-containing protein n=1 Tax=Actinoallomurus spadix TaxID=79912 RepID=A0ABN0XJ40_9ACTN|nr:ATP-binding protein [Actinoallomurus spadix]MCO5987530.1 ATP-binding protein [Actinoallomurus spadix]